jgi:cytochrome c
LRRRVPALAIAFALVVIWWGLAGPTVPVAIAGQHDADEWEGLPAGAGREEVFALCGACHSLMLVTQQGLSRDRWDEALDWMIDEQEMEALEPAERKLVLDYLAKFYGHDRRARH